MMELNTAPDGERISLSPDCVMAIEENKAANQDEFKCRVYTNVGRVICVREDYTSVLKLLRDTAQQEG